VCFSFAVELTRVSDRSFDHLLKRRRFENVVACGGENMSVTYRGTFSIESSVDRFGVQ
jgi:hypothetical protein